MKTLGSHPGAILFRMCVMVIVIAILIVVFFTYINKVQKDIELTSIARTRDIINSSLVVAFATYAVQSRMDELNELDGANPFDFLRQYQILPPGYIGETELDSIDPLAPGWYYQKHRKQVVYSSRYLEGSYVYRIVLDYDDSNQSGRFEAEFDGFKGLYFMEITAR
jgi:hypothetical protein